MTELPLSRTFPALLREMTERAPDRPFVIAGTWHLSYRAFYHTARRMAGGLARLGVGTGTKVGLMMGNRAEWLLSFAAITMAGGTMVAFNTWWRRREIQHALLLADVEILITADRYLNNDYLAELAAIDRASEAPMLRTIVQLGGEPAADTVPFTQLLEDDGGAEPIEAVIDRVEPDGLACLLFTSGSTGRSKAAGLDHRGIIENCFGIGERMHFTADDRLLLTTPLFYSFACANGLFAVLTHGASIVLLPKYDPGEMLAVIGRERCTAVYAPADAAFALPAHPGYAQADLSSWRTGICPNNILPIYHGMGVTEMITAYGLTECYGNSSNADSTWPLERRLTGMGTPLPGVEIDIVDPLTRHPLPRGEEGEIRIKGHLFPGYYNNPEQTAAVRDQEGWFYTGDAGSFDADGVLMFRGRTGEIIKTNGMNVAPVEVEEGLQEHEAVNISVVTGIDDPARGEMVAAMVVLHEGRHVSEGDLEAHCKTVMASFKVPRFIQIVDASDVPLTDTGKISRKLARAFLTERRERLSARGKQPAA